jgi:hypothetical protein
MTTPPTDPPALATIDLSGGDETPVATAGRIIGGVLLMIIGAAIGLAFGAAWLLGWWWEPISEWVEILGDILLIPAGIGLALLIIGFYLVRRTRRRRAQEAAEEAEFLEQARALAAEQERQAKLPPPSEGGIETRL